MNPFVIGISALLCAMSASADSVEVPIATQDVWDTPIAWQPYTLNFTYASFHTVYSCDTLEDRLRTVLVFVGAKDISVNAVGCGAAGELENSVTLRIKALLPTKMAKSTLSNDTKAEPGYYRVVTLKSTGECELLEQVRDQLLPKFDVTVVKDGLHCFPGQVQLTPQTLQIKSLRSQVADMPAVIEDVWL